MKNRLTHFAFVAWLTISSGYWHLPCLGQGTIYTDRSAFDAVVAGLPGIRREVDFQPPLPPGGMVLRPDIVRYFPPLTISGLTFRGGGAMLIREVTSGTWCINNFDSLTPLMVDMDRPARAFGADFASFLNPVFSSFLATVTLDNGNVFTFTAPANPDFAFFGFVTTQPFSRVTFSDGGLIGVARYHEEMLDNITAVVVPEPTVFGLFAVGALLLGWRFFKRKP